VFLEQLFLGGHNTVATLAQGLPDLPGFATVEPDPVGEIGSSQIGVALAFATVAGGAVARIKSRAHFGLLSVVALAGVRQYVLGYLGDTLFTQGVLPGRHYRHPALDQGFLDSFWRAAPNPDVVSQIRIAPGTTSVGAVAHGTVVGEQAQAHFHGLRIT